MCPLVIHGESQPLYNVVAYRFPVLSVYFFSIFFFSKVSILPVSWLTTRRPRRWSTLFYRWDKKKKFFVHSQEIHFGLYLTHFFRRPTKSSAWGGFTSFYGSRRPTFCFLSGCHKTRGRRRSLTVLYELAQLAEGFDPLFLFSWVFRQSNLTFGSK